MLRRLFVGIAILLFLFACNKGLTPPDSTLILSRFYVSPQGGNPVGCWEPDSINPVEVTILDDIEVDSFYLDAEVDGYFLFAYDEICSVKAVMSLKPEIYIDGEKIPLDVHVLDTITGTGPYDVLEDQILHAPLQSTNFKLDTLGFTSEQDRLELISLPNTFNYIIEIKLYFVFHLVRSQELALARKRQDDFSHPLIK